MKLQKQIPKFDSNKYQEENETFNQGCLSIIDYCIKKASNLWPM